MFTPTVANYRSMFYPMGNTPALNLCRHLPPGLAANVLLLGCGDVRNIMYSAYSEVGLPSRRLDITCCDAEENILARNVLFFSFLLDHRDLSKDTLWNVYYHLYLDESDIQVLSTQVNKLLDASKTLDDWKASDYGNTMFFSDEMTFQDVRKVWTAYATAINVRNKPEYYATFKANISISLETRKQCFEKKAADNGMTTVMTGMRSAAPFSLKASSNVAESFEYFWKHGVTGPLLSNIPNPLIAASVSENRILHYGSDPILGFHLGTAFASLTHESPLKPTASSPEGNAKFKLVAAAKLQFSEWVNATIGMLTARKLILRFVAADVFAFCHTLQNYAATGAVSSNWFKRQFDGRILSLDPNASTPKNFDIIDTSNLADHVGTLNILVSALPLLTLKPWATLSTETLLRGNNPPDTKTLDKLLYGHSPLMQILLNVVPVEYWTNATCNSKVDEISIALDQRRSLQTHNRIAWKHATQFAGVNSPAPLKMDPEKLALPLFQSYLKMFHHEDFTAMLNASKTGNVSSLLISGYPTCHRGTFVALLKYIKARMSSVDFQSVCVMLDDLVLSDRTLAFGVNQQQDWTLQLHFHNVWSPPRLGMDLQHNPALGTFNVWKSLPEIVAVTFVIPRDEFNHIYGISPASKVAAPTLICTLTSNAGTRKEQYSMFGDVFVRFGTTTLNGSPEDDSFSVTVQEDKSGWLGSSPLIASFYVPTAMLQMKPEVCALGLNVAGTLQSMSVYLKDMGTDMFISKTRLDDEKRVFVTKFVPGQTGYSVHCAAAHLSSLPSTGGIVEDESSPALANTSFTIDTEQCGDLKTITGHADIGADRGKEFLTNRAAIEILQSSPFVIEVILGNDVMIQSLHFPVAVDAKNVRTRIDPKSAFIEIIVPTADPAGSRLLANFMFPVVLSYTSSGIPRPVTLNSHHLSLDQLPVLDLTDVAALKWLTPLISFQFSRIERRFRLLDKEEQLFRMPDFIARLNYKEMLLTLFNVVAGLHSKNANIFAINHPERDGIHFLIFVSSLRLDAAASSVVLDAAILPHTKGLDDFIAGLGQEQMCPIDVNDRDLVLLKHVLPNLVERARTWSHKRSCEYSKNKTVPISLIPEQPVICSCGKGELPADFVSVPGWEQAAIHATRIAISPTFAVPFVEDVIDRDLWNSAMSHPDEPVRGRSIHRR